MDSKGKRRGFIKTKLVMPFRAVTAQYSGRMKPGKEQLTTTHAKVHSGSTTSVDFIMKQDQRIPQPKPKPSFFIPDADSGRGHDYYSALFGLTADDDDDDDDSVDLKAASYISTVQERFKLERPPNSEYNKLQHVQS